MSRLYSESEMIRFATYAKDYRSSGDVARAFDIWDARRIVNIKKIQRKPFEEKVKQIINLNRYYEDGKTNESFNALRKANDELIKMIEDLCADYLKDELFEMWNALDNLFKALNKQMERD